MNSALKGVLIIAISCLAIPATQDQSPKSDISTVIAAGKVNGDTYTNTYFGISLTVPKAHFTSSSQLMTAGRAANLVQVVSDAPQGAENYTVTIRAISREVYPKDITITDYIARIRREMEKEGLEIKRDGVQVVISGVRFTGVVVLVMERPNLASIAESIRVL